MMLRSLNMAIARFTTTSARFFVGALAGASVSIFAAASARAESIKIVDWRGLPIVGAQVLIGMRQGEPFDGNLLVTGSDGTIAAPARWTAPLPVTVDAASFVRATYFDRVPSSSALALRPQAVDQRPVLQGNLSGYGNLSDDGYVHFGLVFAGFALGDLGSFQLANFISPVADTISVAGNEIDVPSNISLPLQNLAYDGFIPVEFNKPTYRAFFEYPGPRQAVAVQARFELAAAVNGIQSGQSFASLLNLMEFKSAGTHDVALNGPSTTLDFSVNQVAFDSSVSLTAPAHAAKDDLFGFALVNSQNLYYPSDVKRLDSGQTRRLNFPAAATGKLLLALKPSAAPTTGAASETMSISLSSDIRSQPPPLLPFFSPPTIQNTGTTATKIVATPPIPVAGSQPGFVYAALSIVEKQPSGKIAVERKLGQWDLYSEGWPSSLDIPQWPTTGPALRQQLRWEETFVAVRSGSALSPAVLLGPLAFEKASHVVKSAVDL